MKTQRIAISLVALVLATSTAVHAGGITSPEMYVYLDQQARQITLEGMQARLEALSADEADPGRLRAIDAATRAEIRELFASWGVSASAHAAYGSRHAQAIEAWLETHPSWAAAYAELRQRFDTLSASLSAAR